MTWLGGSYGYYRLRMTMSAAPTVAICLSCYCCEEENLCGHNLLCRNGVKKEGPLCLVAVAEAVRCAGQRGL